METYYKNKGDTTVTKHHPDKLKKEVVTRVIDSKDTVKSIATEFGVPVSTVYSWVSKYEQDEHYFNEDEHQPTLLSTKQLHLENAILKCALHIDNTSKSKFRFIYLHKDKFPVQTMCRLLDVSSSGYYKYAQHYKSREQLLREHVTERVRDIYLEYDGVIGSPKITDIINEKEELTSQATVARILQRHKDDWLAAYTQFHEDKDVQLHFHQKDTVYDILNDKHYHEVFASDKIKKIYEAAQLINFTRYDQTGVTSVNDYTMRDNLIIRGDNLIALHKLKSTFKHKVKLIYIDVPYNTERTNLSYADNQSRHQYLLMLKNRLEVARELLRKDGSIFLHCDDREQAYIKVLCDEVLGEENFINQIIWRKSMGQQNRAHIANTKEYILVYSKSRSHLQLNKRELTKKQLESYKYEDSSGKFRIDKIEDKQKGYYNYQIITPTSKYLNSRWLYSHNTFQYLLDKGLIYWARDGTPYKKSYLTNTRIRTINDLWVDVSEYGSTREATEELREKVGNNSFTYPKPEKLLQKIIEVASNEGEIVLDFYAGSGTTLAVAHRLNRQYIGVELLDSNFRLITQRLQDSLKQHSNRTHNSFITTNITK